MPRDETMRQQSDGPDDPSRAYEAYALRCWACEARERAAIDAAEVNRGRPEPGAYFVVTERRNGSR